MSAQIVRGLSNSEYHSREEISKSGLDEIEKSPLHYWDKYINPEKPEPVWTDAFTIGAALHALVLEPQNFDNDFASLPSIDKRTKAGKETYATWEQENQDKILITPTQRELCDKMVEAIQSHELANSYLDGFGEAEQSIFFEWNDVKCRCRPDYIRQDGVIVDLKTAACAHPTIWPKKAYDFRYHVQAAFYAEGYRQAYGELPKAFVFVAVEKSPPYGVSVFKASDELYRAGTIDALRNLETYRRCLEKNEWPGYGEDHELDLSIPAYARNKYEEQE